MMHNGNAESIRDDSHDAWRRIALARCVDVHRVHCAFCIVHYDVHIVPGLQPNPNPTIRSSRAS